MSTLDLFLTYFGAVVLILIFMYGTSNYLISLFAGYLAFCVFYFAFGVKTFEWTAASMAPDFKDASLIYIISFVIGVIIYKILPSKKPVEA